MKQVRGRNGEVLTVAAARAKDARPSNVHWLTPRTWRRWIDVGLRGHGRDGVPEPGWAGRLEDRNVAFTRLLVSSGLRRAEGGSLLTFEVPALRLDGGRYYRGKVAAEVTRSKKDRTFYVAADAVGEIEAYADSSRAWAVARGAAQGPLRAAAGAAGGHRGHPAGEARGALARPGRAVRRVPAERADGAGADAAVHRGPARAGAVVAVAERAGHAVRGALVGGRVPRRPTSAASGS